MPIEIAGQPCLVRHPILSLHEAAFLLQEPEVGTRNRFRRGERLSARGLSDEEVVETGALPNCGAGRSRAVRPAILARHPKVAGNPMAIELLRALVSGRFRAPKATSAKALPPALDRRIHRL
jgi:hypothetical protein